MYSFHCFLDLYQYSRCFPMNFIITRALNLHAGLETYPYYNSLDLAMDILSYFLPYTPTDLFLLFDLFAPEPAA